MILLTLAVLAFLTGCSKTPFFDQDLANELETALETPGAVRCDHRVKDLWLCSYEPDLGSNSSAEVIVRRRADGCWRGRLSRPDAGTRILHGCT